ncbi:MFS transporter [uncultured Psychroserpens sp.]|uniref:MFS transporter n=1 Tax=uncultured Psychroserpens sp. TaxID=255436 RepID=UPI002616484B|nr:MFS transporter [uncultured Psychroserpens sp.]
MQQTHSLNAFLYAISYGIERASYYGIRSIIVLYMVSESIQMTNSEALYFYGILTSSFYGSKVLGALLGDLLIGNKLALLIGGLLQAFSCFILCIPTQSFFYIGIIFFVLGNGLLSPNLLAQFGKQYSNKPKLVDSGFTGLYFFINFGAFLGVAIISLLANKHMAYGFVFSGILLIISTLMAYFLIDLKPTYDKNKTDNDKIKSFIFVFAALVFSVVFWASYDASAELMYSHTYGSKSSSFIMQNIPVIVGIVLGFLLTVIWTFVYTNQFSKFCIGLILSAFAISLLIYFPESPSDGNTSTLLFSFILLSIGETFLGPMLYATITRYTNPKYLAIVFSLVTIPIFIFNKIAFNIRDYFDEISPSGILIAITFALAFYGLISILMWFFQKRDDQNVLSEYELIE